MGFDPDRAMSPAEIRRTWRGYKMTIAALFEALDAGWVAVEQSKHYRIYCECSGTRASLQVGGTPRSDGVMAGRIRKAIRDCPDRHDLITRPMR